MLASTTELERRLTQRASRLLGGSSRYVDLAVEVRAIDGPGWERYGGRFDTVSRAWCGKPTEFARWTVGQGQMPPLQAESRFVCIGAMGAGKTEVLARAAITRALRSPGKAIGVVAPTQKRLQICWGKIAKLLRPEWVTEVRLGDGEIVLANGCRIQFVAAKIYSKDVGSPIQGYSWVACYIDEEQDIDDEAMADCMMRGRDAPGGIYPVVSTCTLKDTPQWRARKAKYEADSSVTVYRMEALANPFVATEYWDSLRTSLTPRQWRMRVLALDARPERATYPDFDRDLHIRPKPAIGAFDATRAVCGAPILIGHDPGSLHDVSLLLKCYEIDNTLHWWVIGEVTTDGSTTAAHVQALTEYLRKVHYTDPGECKVVADPYGYAVSTKPDVAVYKVFKRAGYSIRPAAYSKAKGGGAKPGMVPKDAAIEMVCTLLKSANNETRLYIHCDDAGKPVAEKLVTALECEERDEAGRAEMQKKDSSDTSHWAAALRYALHPYEQARVYDNQRWRARK